VVSDDRRFAGAITRVDLDSFLEWPQGIARLGVILSVVIAVAFGLVYFVLAVERLGDDADRNAALNFDDREFGGGNSLVVDKRALYEARALIPKDETYRIVAGPGVKGATDLTQPYIDQFARYFLMPLRPASDAHWILCYGCDRSELGGRFKIAWQNDGGISLGTIR
jgi:hypothetical protein